MQHQPVDHPVVDEDDSDIITSTELETAVNLASHPASSDVELSADIVEFLTAQGEVSWRTKRM
jgi:hypothetical protein